MLLIGLSTYLPAGSLFGSVGFLLGLIAALLFLIALFGTYEEKYQHIVRIRSAAGEIDAFGTYDSELAETLILALNDAIVD